MSRPSDEWPQCTKAGADLPPAPFVKMPEPRKDGRSKNRAAHSVFKVGRDCPKVSEHAQTTAWAGHCVGPHRAVDDACTANHTRWICTDGREQRRSVSFCLDLRVSIPMNTS